MAKTVPLEKWHINSIDEHVTLWSLKDTIDEEGLDSLVDGSHAYAIVEGKKVLACAGLVEFWPGRAESWAILDKNAKEHFIKVHRQVKHFLDNVGIKRIEAVVEYDFKEGRRWAELLGFKIESPYMQAYGLAGEDSTMYVRIQGDA